MCPQFELVLRGRRVRQLVGRGPERGEPVDGRLAAAGPPEQLAQAQPLVRRRVERESRARPASVVIRTASSSGSRPSGSSRWRRLSPRTYGMVNQR